MSASVRPDEPFDREVALRRLREERFDVLVVGGGITGAGVALDAAARGLRTALVEREDFATGTSSRSSKLVHGGLRYLRQGEIGLVHQSLGERQALLENAPHLVHPLTFVIPLFGSGGAVDRTVARAYSTALWAYDIAGGWRIGRRHRRIGAAEVARHAPTLRVDRVVAGFLYHDARADDARLTLAVARTAVLDHGAVAANHAPVVGLLKDAAGRVCGARVAPPDGAPFEVHADAVVNATGVWADDLRALDERGAATSLRPAKGIHIVVPQTRLPCDLAVVVPARDGRSVFVIPWDGHTLVGTTDTAYTGPLDDPPVDDTDIAYLLDAVNDAFSQPLTAADVSATWAGLRPLLATAPGRWRRASGRTADLSRRHRVAVSPDGLVTVTGGKLTTYRRMAADTVDVVRRRLGRGWRGSPTRHIRLRGAVGLEALRTPGAAAGLGVDADLLDHLVSRYGGEATDVLALLREAPGWAERLVPGLPYRVAEVIHAARREMAMTVDDALARRTRVLTLDAGAARSVSRRVAELLGAELGWDAERVTAEAARFEAAVAPSRRPDLPPGRAA